MTEAVVEIPRMKWANQRTLRLDKGFADALRDYCKHRWPTHTAKSAARAFDLSVDEGRSVANGTPSKTTIEKVFKNGGLSVALPVIEEVCGQSIAGFIRDVKGVHHENRERLRALAGDGVLSAAGRSFGDTGVSSEFPRGRSGRRG